MNVFFSYILLGLSLAAPIGPINAAQIDSGIKNGFTHSWFVGIGATIADMIYMFIVYFGVFHFIQTPIVKTFLWLFGCFVLVYTGIESLCKANQIHRSDIRESKSLLLSFGSGFFMSITNPLTILFWLGIYGSVLANTAASSTSAELIMYSCAIFIGIFLWDITMAAVSSSFRNLLKSRALVIISILSSASLILFGLFFGYKGMTLLFG